MSQGCNKLNVADEMGKGGIAARQILNQWGERSAACGCRERSWACTGARKEERAASDTVSQGLGVGALGFQLACSSSWANNKCSSSTERARVFVPALPDAGLLSSVWAPDGAARFQTGPVQAFWLLFHVKVARSDQNSLLAGSRTLRAPRVHESTAFTQEQLLQAPCCCA